ncbi:Formin-like protein 2 [Geodia barretti]|uniref:Formin-like protein 2 n=1 Tax=Geodia barretti TaxID=519541 RepID=A0AA35RFR0_GEOBA|nr:Formin-like protein 2 [Geodia barretti]
MNSSRRGGVFGFRLQSLDIVSDTRAPGDRSTTLMGFVAGVVREKYPNVLEFVNEVTYLEKAATVSLQLLGVDIRQMSRGLKETTKELVENKQNKKLKKFCLEAEPRVTRLEADFATANEAFQEVVHTLGRTQKLPNPMPFFPSC